MSDIIERAIEFFRRHKRAYQQVFNKHSPATQYVLADLQHRCYAQRSTASHTNDPIQIARNEGKREIWLVIQRALNLTPEEMFDLARQAKEVQK